MPAPIIFVVPGVRTDRGATRGAGSAASPIGRVKDSITVTAQRAAGESEIRTTAIPGEDVVLIEVAGGPELWLHPDTARDLLQSQQDPLLARGAGDTPLAKDEVRVSARLQWRLEEGAPVPGATRGLFGDVLVRAFHVLTGFAEDKAADFVASKVVQAFDSKVDPGVYKLDRILPESFKGRTKSAIASGEAPSLVLIHGTFSETTGTFGKLWKEHSAARRRPVRQISEPDLRTRPSDARGKPDRERHYAGGSGARGCTAPSAHALAWRIGCRSAGPGVQRSGGVHRPVRQ